MTWSLKVCIEARKLALLDGSGSTVREYDIITGRLSHEGHKCREGDQRTPRGCYHICTINEKSAFAIFYGISYPGLEDGIEGLRQGVINRRQYEEIERAAVEKKRPPWDTPLGGEVGIHGGGIERDGTRGCIGMSDEDALSLKEYVYLGMPVSIE